MFFNSWVNVLDACPYNCYVFASVSVSYSDFFLEIIWFFSRFWENFPLAVEISHPKAAILNLQICPVLWSLNELICVSTNQKPKTFNSIWRRNHRRNHFMSTKFTSRKENAFHFIDCSIWFFFCVKRKKLLNFFFWFTLIMVEHDLRSTITTLDKPINYLTLFSYSVWHFSCMRYK